MAEDKYTVMVGNVSDGLKAYGPFSLKEAENCIDGFGSPAIVMTLHPDPFAKDYKEKETAATVAVNPLTEKQRDTIRTSARWVTSVEETLPRGTAAREEAFSLVNDLYSIANTYPTPRE